MWRQRIGVAADGSWGRRMDGQTAQEAADQAVLGALVAFIPWVYVRESGCEDTRNTENHLPVSPNSLTAWAKATYFYILQNSPKIKFYLTIRDKVESQSNIAFSNLPRRQ